MALEEEFKLEIPDKEADKIDSCTLVQLNISITILWLAKICIVPRFRFSISQ